MPAEQAASQRKALIPVRPEDMPLGKPLPWPLYDRAGVLVAPAGFVVDSAEQRAKLAEVAPRREASGLDRGDAGDFLRQLADKPSPDEVMIPSTGQRDALGRMKHNIETVRLSFILPGDVEPRKATVPWVGRLAGAAIVVGAPALGGSRSWHQHEGLSFDVKAMLGRGLYSFEARLIRFAATPAPHLLLSYPHLALFKEIRQSTRVAAKLPCVVTVGEGAPVQTIMVNVSGHGCAVKSEYVLGDPGARVTLSFRVSANGQSHLMTLPATLRSKTTSGRIVTSGLQFDPEALRRDWHLPLVLKSFVYDQMIDG